MAKGSRNPYKRFLYTKKPFYILKHSYCAAAITRMLSWRSLGSLVSCLESEIGKKTVVELCAEGIVNNLNSQFDIFARPAL